MSLHTRILLTRPHAVAEVHRWINAELLNAPGAQPEPLDGSPGHGELILANQRGQRLDALAWITYRPDGPIPAQRLVGEDADGHEVFEDIATGSMLVHFDTSYGWRDGAAGCTELHAWYVLQLARRFGPVWWLNEYVGLWNLLELEDGAPAVHEVLAFSVFGDPELYRPGSMAA